MPSGPVAFADIVNGFRLFLGRALGIGSILSGVSPRELHGIENGNINTFLERPNIPCYPFVSQLAVFFFPPTLPPE